MTNSPESHPADTSPAGTAIGDGGPSPTDPRLNPDGKPELLFYCQHSLGLGHLVRSLALTAGLTRHFHVVLLNGGRLPSTAVVPPEVTVVNLVPLGHNDAYDLVSHDPTLTVEQAMQARTRTIMAWLDRGPQVVLVELYPFGRKKFAFELEPLLERAAAMGQRRPLVVCSLRDILVGQRRDQARHDERASAIANRYFDAILVHADPRFARLEESFQPATPLRPPVYYTGFVAPDAPELVGDQHPVRRVLVSAGGGMVGEPLYRAAVDAAPLVWQTLGLTTTVVAGPFAPTAVWNWLVEQAELRPELNVVRYVDDLAAEMRRSTATVSQCGYNTTMDILRAGVPAVVIPYAEGKEDEQTRRAERMEQAGVLRVLPATRLSGTTLADAIGGLTGSRPSPTALDLGGRDRTADLLAELTSVLV